MVLFFQSKLSKIIFFSHLLSLLYISVKLTVLISAKARYQDLCTTMRKHSDRFWRYRVNIKHLGRGEIVNWKSLNLARKAVMTVSVLWSVIMALIFSSYGLKVNQINKYSRYKSIMIVDQIVNNLPLHGSLCCIQKL